MRAVVQRVSRARVVVEERVTGEIAAGVVVLLGVARTDTAESAAYLAEKTAHLRIFDDDSRPVDALHHGSHADALAAPMPALNRRLRV